MAKIQAGAGRKMKGFGFPVLLILNSSSKYLWPSFNGPISWNYFYVRLDLIFWIFLSFEKLNGNSCCRFRVLHF